MPVVLRAAHKATIRRAPSLEENLENTTSMNVPIITGNSDSVHSSKTSILKHSPCPSSRMVSFEDKSSGTFRHSSTGASSSSTDPVCLIPSHSSLKSNKGKDDPRRSETLAKVEAINSNVSTSMSKPTTDSIPSSRKSLVRNEISSGPVTSFDPSEKFHSSTQASLTLVKNSTGESTPFSVSVPGSSTSSKNCINTLSQQTTEQIMASTSSSSSSALQVASSAKINRNFSGCSSSSPQQSQCNIKSVNATAITNTISSASSPAVASSVLPTELNSRSNGSGAMTNVVLPNNIVITSADPKMRINSKKLAKALSVVEESPKMERKYEISSPNPV